MIRQVLRRSIASLSALLLALTLTACGGGGGGGSSDTGGGTTNPPATTTSGSVAFAQPSYSYPENSATARVYVTRSGGTDGVLSVTWTTEDGTARAGSDYVAASGTLTWADGDAAEKEIAVTLVDDSTAEDDETFDVTLSGGATATLTVTVQNDDFGPTSGHIDQIKARQAHESGWNGAGVKIAVIEAAVNAAHRELAAESRQVETYDVNGSDPDVSGAGEEHGTHVAGLAIGVRVGSAPGADGLLLKAAVDGHVVVSHADVMAARQYAISNGARVISQSFVDREPDAAQDATDAGLLLVTGAGNAGVPLGAYLGELASYADDPRYSGRLLPVGAVDASGNIATFSNRAGTVQRFLVAPGVSVNSSCYEAVDYYCTMSGTSQATPIVAGAAAIIMQRYPALTADQVADVLLDSATDLGEPGWDSTYGAGLVNVQAAMAVAALRSGASRAAE